MAVPWIRLNVIGEFGDDRIRDLLKVVRECGFRNDRTEQDTAPEPSANLHVIVPNSLTPAQFPAIGDDISMNVGPSLLLRPEPFRPDVHDLRLVSGQQGQDYSVLTLPDGEDIGEWPRTVKRVREWIKREVQGGAELDGTRGAIESLYRWVQLSLVENDRLNALVAALEAEAGVLSGELTEAQIEIRTLKASLAQVQQINESLIAELGKRDVDRRSSTLLVRALQVVGGASLTLALTMGGTYAGTRAALPAEQAAEITELRAELEAHCEQTIVIIDDDDVQISDSGGRFRTR